MPIDEMDEELVANGVSAATGAVLPQPDPAAVERLIRGEGSASLTVVDNRIKKARTVTVDGVELESFGIDHTLDPEDLAQAGWGVIFAADIGDDVKRALAPLLEKRKAQAGKHYHAFEDVRPDDDAVAWLGRQGYKPGLDIVDPEKGVPYYLLIVGSPASIPMSFQYVLDTYWAVGRIFFPACDDYAQYARSVVAYEEAERPPQYVKRAVLFAPEHAFDAATRMFTRDVAKPFLDEGGARPLGRRQKFHVQPLIGDDATKEKLVTALRGGGDDGKAAPALLFSGGHGMAFDRGHELQVEHQGALVCQDWKPGHPVQPTDYFSASDVKDMNLSGMIHFMFACYGGGWEMYDTFRDENGRAPQIADAPRIARLPQAMLAHPEGGALAVVAHVDRAWSYSFRTASGGIQTTGMREVLDLILMGRRVGNALDRFNLKWAVLSAPLADAMRDFERGTTSAQQLAKLWIARDDARNYVVIGDPAVRLRVENMRPSV
ncbi:C25 family cysteine peptidase [Methylobacterium sp. 17Sr1-1]|uniref:C25 family cysteine peptidase n=1 Tax=Methylobacterium sp. 17Sr1-1 TaxID=2202826 RepID=UPI000D700931|nr:C25 family cysteine peptidase [Methylobacterium sp. 17Sr1-1]AWN52160.1 hypothetical protein DK412_11160 [Methylobacterium sp. 17Sr1-1]